MAREVLCMQDNLSFPSEAAFQAHKASGHKLMTQATPLDAPEPTTPPPGVVASSLPTREFLEMVNRIENKDTKEVAPSLASSHPKELPPSAPITLTYKFLGECQKCRTPIDTLELDLDKNHFVVAFCNSGKHQVESRLVAKL